MFFITCWEQRGQSKYPFEPTVHSAFEATSFRGRPRGLTRTGRFNVFATMAWKRGLPRARS